MSTESRRARARMSDVERAALGRALEDVQLRARIGHDHDELRAAEEASPLEADRDDARRALRVVVLTPHIRRYLEQNDPMALRQARLALGLTTELAVTPEPLTDDERARARALLAEHGVPVEGGFIMRSSWDFDVSEADRELVRRFCGNGSL